MRFSQLPAEDRQALLRHLFAEQHGHCALCGGLAILPTLRIFKKKRKPNGWKYLMANVDHIVPQSYAMGFGRHDPEDLVMTHQWCNSVRGDVPFSRARLALWGRGPLAGHIEPPAYRPSRDQLMGYRPLGDAAGEAC